MVFFLSSCFLAYMFFFHSPVWYFFHLMHMTLHGFKSFSDLRYVLERKYIFNSLKDLISLYQRINKQKQHGNMKNRMRFLKETA